MFVLPEFKKSYSDLEPYIDAQTMEIHHTKHHGGYVRKLNQACVDNDLECDRIEDLFERMSELPTAIRNNAGGHYNHTMFWTLLDTKMTRPDTDLHEQIEQTFGGLEDFKAEFTKAALGVFGSGWVWLVAHEDNGLEIVTTKNQDNPLMDDINKGYPILGVDVWEHAYYLKYQNKRVDYIKAMWAVINWEVVSDRYSTRPEMSSIL